MSLPDEIVAHALDAASRWFMERDHLKHLPYRERWAGASLRIIGEAAEARLMCPSLFDEDEYRDIFISEWMRLARMTPEINTETVTQ